jgi:hypothetical protein
MYCTKVNSAVVRLGLLLFDLRYSSYYRKDCDWYGKKESRGVPSQSIQYCTQCQAYSQVVQIGSPRPLTLFFTADEL